VKRRSFIAMGALAAPAIVPARAWAQSALPTGGISIYVGYVGGGGTDIAARIIATKLERRLGRHVTVQNRPGSSGTIPGELMKKGIPNGLSLAFLPSTMLVSKLAAKDFPFDPLTDLAPVSLAGSFAIGLAASPKLQLATFDDYLQYVKVDEASRRKLGSTSSSAFIQVLNLMLNRSIGTTLQTVDYRGSAPLVNDLRDGTLPAAVSAIPSLLPGHRGHNLKLLMTTGSKRLVVAQDIPTAIELGHPELTVDEWFGVFAPPGTPGPVIAEWNRQIGGALADPDVAGELQLLGLSPDSSTADELATQVASHQKNWEERMKTVGITPID
jgi:tripartite-type tricarboxylate transporter receptor subunit TctC